MVTARQGPDRVEARQRPPLSQATAAGKVFSGLWLCWTQSIACEVLSDAPSLGEETLGGTLLTDNQLLTQTTLMQSVLQSHVWTELARLSETLVALHSIRTTLWTPALVHSRRLLTDTTVFVGVG